MAAFEAADDVAEATDDARDALAAALEAEDYSAAAAAKAALDAALVHDGTAVVAAALKAAVAREDYAAAASLRDAGGAGLVGWWHAAPACDVGGHLLRVARDGGRYTGLAFRAGDLADVAGCGDDPLGALLGAGPDVDVADAGTPALEVLVVASPGAEAIATQAVVLRPVLLDSEDEGDDGDDDDLSPPRPRSPLDAAAVAVRVEPGHGRPGRSASVDVSVSADGGAAARGDDASLAARVAAAFGVGAGRRGRRADDGAGDDAEDVAGVSHDDGGDGDGLDDSDDPRGPPPRVLLDLATATPFDVARAPASITWHGPDAFTLHAGELDGEEEEDEEEEESEAASASTLPRLPTRLAGRVGTSDTSSSSSADALRAAAADVAREVRAAADAAGGGALPLSEADLAARVRSSIADALGAALGDDDGVSVGVGASLGGLSGDVTYRRLPVGPPPTDPFDGLYLASFGVDGPELVRVTREGGGDVAVARRLASDAGAPAGEPRFRARVGRAERLHGGGDGAYPPELGVRARYKGTAFVPRSPRGRRARSSPPPGPVPATPTDGELLVLSGRPHPATRGAGLGFVWAGPGDRRHLVLLTRVELDDPAVNGGVM
jgi:hypothetical protein